MQLMSDTTVRTTIPLVRAIPLAAAGVALLGLLAVNLSHSTAVQSRESTAPNAIARAADVIAPPATMEIVPALVVDHGAQHFVGTGDGSAGYWVR
jgi:hypothetical protein